ncbi:hypothetical protein DID88_010158 [Monilinia fructigena]|uniref:Cytochrome b561 domain-containing protein n=1 Tax=Monilinia fructigena TaxID=38457 RepID=A0A395IN67_9HELO|nr:hypothetical protein DID88_010158 [Monilinia fructigena]
MKRSNLVPFLAAIISIIPTAFSLATYSTTSGGPSYSLFGINWIFSSQSYDKAHGIIMGMTVVLLFPLGFNRPTPASGPGSSSSGPTAITGTVVTASLGTIITNTTHMIFGIILVVLFFIQPFIGLIHHWRYMKTRQRGIFGWVHLWYGRILIVLAVINGGLGLKLAANSRNGEIAYGVVCCANGAVLYWRGDFYLIEKEKKR